MLKNRLKKLQIIPIFLMTVLLASCGSDSSSSQGASQGSNYKDTKSMVLDILKSDDGKKAITAATQGGSGGSSGGGASSSSAGGQSQIKLLSSNESLHLQMAVKDVLTAQENNKFLQDMMKDPKFAGDFAKAIKTDTKQMFKELLKDPEYQKSLVDVMKNPDYEKMMMDSMKTAPYRQQMMTVMQDAVKSPLFRAQMIDLLKAAIEQQSQPQQLSQQGKKGDQSGGGKGGGQGDSEGESKKKDDSEKKKKDSDSGSDSDSDSSDSSG